ncbi:MAG: hypothetical protein AAF570_00970 [Bacteroidota bacterium]
MKKIHLIITCLFAALFMPQLKAQDGYFGDIGYKLGSTRLNNAYATYFLANPNDNARTFTLYSDGFWQNNFTLNFGNNSESIYWRVNVDGMIYGLADLVSSSRGKTGPVKSKWRKWDKLVEENPQLEKDPETWNSASNYPGSGGGDYQLLDVDFAVGGDELKFGLHWAVGFLGANGAANGVYLGTGSLESNGASAFNMGYNELGVKAFVFEKDGTPFQASVGLNYLATTNARRFDRRRGFGIDLEGKYFFSESPFMPYVGGYYEFKRMAEGTEPIYAAGNPVLNPVPNLNAHAIGVTFGVLVSQE